MRGALASLLVAALAAGCAESDQAKSIRFDAGGRGDGAPSSPSDAAASADGGLPAPPKGGGFVDASFSFDAGGAPDAGSAADAVADRPPGAADAAGAPSDAAGGADAARPPDAPPRCSVEVRALSAASLTRLVSGPMATAVVRAELSGASAPGPLLWSWEVTDVDSGERLTVNADPRDPAVVEFAVRRAGQYLIRAETTVGTLACASGPVYALARDPAAQRKLFLVRAIPPSSARAPVQHQVLEVAGGVPVVAELRLAAGTSVTINPREQSGLDTIVAYVRVSDRATPLVLEGYADANAPFGALLAASSYDVLVVPAGPDRSGLGARHAPVFLERLDPADIQASPFRLAPGVAVRGRAASAGGAIQDARVVLRGSGIPSTVGRSGADGEFEVLARSGTYGLVIAPPRESGLPEGQLPPALTLGEGTPGPRVDFTWHAVNGVNAALAVQDAAGRPLARARVRAEAPLAEVGIATITPAGGAPVAQPAPGTMRLDLVTDAGGVARLGSVPRASYAVIVAPANSAEGAITAATVSFTDAGTRTVQLSPRSRLTGRLSGPSGASLGGVRITATDVGTDLAVPAEVAETAADGSFTLSVSARRKYLLVAQPPPGSPYARSFVGAGPVEASEFPLRQTLPVRISFSGRVVSDVQRSGIAETVIKVFCFPGAADCPDATVPLAEAVTGPDGTFELALPDPSSR
jgi:hypothetical protein